MKSEFQSVVVALPGGRVFSAHQAAWNEHLELVKWCKVPTSYRDHVMRACSSKLQTDLVMHIMFATIGAKTNARGEQPEWCQIPMAKLAKIYFATVNGVAGALAKIGAVKMKNGVNKGGVGIIEARSVGRVNEYRLTLKNWNASLQPVAAEEEAATLPPGRAIGVPRGKSSPWLDLKEPARKARVVNKSGAAIQVNHEIVDGALRITISDAVSSSSSLGEHTANDLTTTVGRFSPQPVESTHVDQLSRELTELLTAKLVQKLQSPPPPSMVRAAAMRLSGADLGLAEFATTLAVKGKRFNTWGFLSAVVQDCINAHEHIPRAAHALIDEQRQEAERYLQLEYAEYRREEARRAVELMTEGAREKLRSRAELRLREQARWERMTNAARVSEVRQCMISDTAASLNIPSFEAWRVTREQQMDQLMSEEAHLA